LAIHKVVFKRLQGAVNNQNFANAVSGPARLVLTDVVQISAAFGWHRRPKRPELLDSQIEGEKKPGKKTQQLKLQLVL
jgi:hypothetical protein